jgi:16S rRNA (guanine527-N7)-methyltransferase
MTLAESLAQGIAKLDLRAEADTQRKLLDYLALIVKWNRVHNLTAVRESAKMVSAHLLDCLAVVSHLEAGTVLDVGSGAGLPGIPLALMWPQAHVTLLDSNHKKATFLKQAAIELGLNNVNVVCERIEKLQSQTPFDLVISRAFSALPDFISCAGTHCAAQGTIAAMKGVFPHEELAQLPPGFKLSRVQPLSVPGLHAERHLVLITHER